MRILVLFALSLVVSVSASVELRINYHDSVGIPLAERIRAIENEIATKNLGHNDLLQNRIVGGQEAPLHAYPYFAGLFIDLNGTHNKSVCGASLLSPNRLVTAAHCWADDTKQAWQFIVILGSNFFYSTDGERIPTTKVITHPHYVAIPLRNDVAMIYLPRNAHINNFSIKPINLPHESELRNQFVGYSAVATGFGKIIENHDHSRVLRHVRLTVISQTECANVFPDVVTNNNICTSGSGGVGICSGDSGGPLVTYGYDNQPFLIGIVGFNVAKKCDQGLPSGFSRVTSFYSFITQHL